MENSVVLLNFPGFSMLSMRFVLFNFLFNSNNPVGTQIYVFKKCFLNQSIVG